MMIASALTLCDFQRYKHAVGSKSLKQAMLLTVTYDLSARSINLQDVHNFFFVDTLYNLLILS